MGRIRGWMRGSLLFKIVFTFLIVVVPVCLLALYLNQLAMNHVKREIVDSMQTKASFYLNSLVTELERMTQLQKQFVNDEDVMRFSIMNDTIYDYEKTAAHLRLQQRLLLVKNSSHYIRRAAVYFPAVGITVSTDYQDMPAEEAQGLLAAPGQAAPSLQYWDDRLFSVFRYPDVLLSRTPTFLLTLELSQPNLARDMTEFAAGSGGAVLFSNSSSWKIAVGSGGETEEKIVSFWKGTAPAEAEEAASGEARLLAAGEGREYMILPKYSEAYDLWLALYMPKEAILGPLDRISAWSWALLGLSMLVVLLFSFRIYKIIHLPMRRLVSAFRIVEKGNLEMHLSYAGKDEFDYLYKQFNTMLYRLKLLIRENYEQKFRIQKAELKQLQSQANPHFLYNFFFILNQMVHAEDYDNLKLFTKYLGHYFQYITRDARDMVPLSEEAAFARAYVEIQTVRYENRIDVRFGEVPAALRDVPVPRLMLQPIVENAYKYVFEQMSSGGILQVRFAEEDGMLIVAVDDNGGGIAAEQLRQLEDALISDRDQSENTAIINIHHRLKLRFGDGGGIRLVRGELGGLSVRLCIPPAGRRTEDMAAAPRGEEVDGRHV